MSRHLQGPFPDQEMVHEVAATVRFDFTLAQHGIAPEPVSFCQVDQPPAVKTPVEAFLHPF